MKKIVSLLLILSLLPAMLLPVSAATDADKKSVGAFAHMADRMLGTVHDAFFGRLQSRLAAKHVRLEGKEYPTYEQYMAGEHPYTYKGTDGVVTGSGWRGGFASGSIIPPEWRCGANGKSDPNGYCFNKTRYTGGYQWKLDKIYSDQMLYVEILSNRTDSNHNGQDDLVLYVSLDGVGIAGGMCKKIRAAIEEALLPCGVESSDILWCSVSATHCHVGLDTQGMHYAELLPILLNRDSDAASLDPVMEKTILKTAAACAAEAFGKMEDGTLSYFETDPVGGVGDNLHCGGKRKDTFSCLLFEGGSGEKTVLANLGAHPKKYYNRRILFADYPYWMGVAMRDAGYNFLFVQSAQANIAGPSAPDGTSEARLREADEWVRRYALTEDDWIERYGWLYAKWNYSDLDPFDADVSESQFEHEMRTAYLLAHHILDASTNAAFLTPSLDIRSAQTCIRLENGLMAMGCISGVLGEDTVVCPEAESGYAVMAETNYIAIGDDVVILTAPGELYPALLSGTDPDYNEPYLWTGKTSWTGEDWPYDPLETIVRGKTGDENKHVLLFGITNDALAYIYPDVMMPQSILIAFGFYPCIPDNRDDMANSVLMTTASDAASLLMESYIRLIEG